MKHQPRHYNISDLYEWYSKGHLILQPKFQRRAVWSNSAKSYLLDTIIRGIPIPKIYLRQQLDIDQNISIREVVDGQQRLRSIFEFIKGNIVISKTHNEEYSNIKFLELPDEIKTEFMTYQISVDILLGATDRDVLDMFTRLNSYTINLVPQEKLNAEFQGDFKQTVYKLSFDHLEFWLNNKILTDVGISRMRDAQLSSELIITMMDGIQDGTNSIKKFYKTYDDEFPEKNKIIKEFYSVIDTIGFLFDDKLKTSKYKWLSMFYTLFCVIYDCLYGIPKMRNERVKITNKNKTNILNSLLNIDKQMDRPNTFKLAEELRSAATKSNTRYNQRIIRHNILYNIIKNSEQREITHA